MRYLFLTAAIFSAPLCAVESQSTTCRYNNEERKIEIIYTQGAEVPCEVHYSKASGTQVLWSAQAETGFCETKAAGLVDKQKMWGWNCDNASSTGNVVKLKEGVFKKTPKSEKFNPEKTEAEAETKSVNLKKSAQAESSSASETADK